MPVFEEFHGKRWPKFNSEKICNIAYGRIQVRGAAGPWAELARTSRAQKRAGSYGSVGCSEPQQRERAPAKDANPLAPAAPQGKAALVQHFQNSSLLHEDKRCRPVLFHTDGMLAGEQEPFPTSATPPL